MRWGSDPIRAGGAMRRLLASLIAAFVSCFLSATLSVDPRQDRLDQIPEEVTALFDLYCDGDLDDDQLTELVEQVLMEEVQLRTGALSVDQLTQRWRDYPTVPVKTPGARLSAVGLPPEFDWLVWALSKTAAAWTFWSNKVPRPPSLRGVSARASRWG
ncbi:MAG: hypothetical protein MK180_14825 [Rhodobacteraceae bacterium]|nr:hypothetical protein [Paracoccaceae bacterium]